MTISAFRLFLFCAVIGFLGSVYADTQIQATNPASMSVTVSGDKDGVDIKPETLKFDSPEMKSKTQDIKAPGNFQSHFDSWEPWPRKWKNKTLSIILKPQATDSVYHAPILGGLFRSIPSDSVKVQNSDGTVFKLGEDFKFNPDWAQICNIDNRLGKPGAPLKVSYKYALQRIDLIQFDPKTKTVSVKKGKSRIVCPMIPTPDDGHVGLAGVYIAPWPRTGKYVITQDDVFPIGKVPTTKHDETPLKGTLNKLRTGQPVNIAFMGDSITLGAEAGQWWKPQYDGKGLSYRGRFIHGLKQRFPKSNITPIDAFQGGITIKPAEKFMKSKVLPQKPNLVIVAFGGNDVDGPVGKPPKNPAPEFKKDLQKLVKTAKEAGSEVIILIESQQNPFMKSENAKRWPAYRKAMQKLAKEENVALADVYEAWMNLAKRGIPPFSQLHNWKNHPGAFGHKVYADTLLDMFPVKSNP